MKRILSVGLLCMASAAALMLWQQSHSPSGTLPAGALNAQESTNSDAANDSQAGTSESAAAESNANDSASDEAASSETEEEEVDISSVKEMTLGPDDAKVTVVEYASFTCPHCATFHKTTFQEMKRDFIDTDKIKFVFRDVYFDKFGLWASLLARCQGPSKFFGVSGVLFDEQKEWVSGKSEMDISNNLRKIGKVAGMNEDQIDSCLDDATKAKALVAWYLKNYEADEITGTPTLIINGEKYSNMPYDKVKAVIEEKLAE